MNNILQLAIAYIVSVMAVHWIFMKVLKIAKVKGKLVLCIPLGLPIGRDYAKASSYEDENENENWGKGRAINVLLLRYYR